MLERVFNAVCDSNQSKISDHRYGLNGRIPSPLNVSEMEESPLCKMESEEAIHQIPLRFFFFLFVANILFCEGLVSSNDHVIK